MNPIIEILVTAISSSGLMSLVMYLIQRRDKKRDDEAAKDSIQNKMLLGLAHDRILQLTDSIIKRGVITSKEKTNLKYLYEPYHELGGNGDCETGYEVCTHLKVVSDATADKIDVQTKRIECCQRAAKENSSDDDT